MNRYELKVVASCPSDGLRDLYTVIIESERTILVEDILAATQALPKAYQEDITRDLARILAARVTTIGWHYGVKTTCSM
jgi:hypothetical protein